MANDSIRGRQVVLRLTNKSGGGVVAGDVVIISSGTAASFTTTTSAGQTGDMVGVVLETIANDGLGRVCIMGYTPSINLSASASLGDTVATHSVAKQAAPSASRGAGSFGEVLGTGTSPAALLWGFPDVSAATGVAGDSIWDAAGDLVQGTGSNTAARLGIGTANQLLRVNSGATAVEWASLGKVLISEQTPTGTGTVTFSSIPATYKSLEIEFVARSTQAAAGTGMFIYFNNDTTASNYREMRQGAAGGTVAVHGAGADSSTIGEISGASAAAGDCGQGKIFIIQYAGTTFLKQAMSIVSYRTASTTFEVIYNFAVAWESAAAINRVDLVLAANNYDTGTTFRLYGVN